MTLLLIVDADQHESDPPYAVPLRASSLHKGCLNTVSNTLYQTQVS